MLSIYRFLPHPQCLFLLHLRSEFMTKVPNIHTLSRNTCQSLSPEPDPASCTGLCSGFFSQVWDQDKLLILSVYGVKQTEACWCCLMDLSTMEVSMVTSSVFSGGEGTAPSAGPGSTVQLQPGSVEQEHKHMLASVFANTDVGVEERI